MNINSNIAAAFISFLSCCLFCLNVHAQCSANAGSDFTICAGEATPMNGIPRAIGVAPFTFSWAPATGLSCTNCANPTASPLATTTYTLTITDVNGCSSSDMVTVTARPLPAASFTFTPDGDCAGIPVQFTNTSAPGLNATWTFGNIASGAANSSNLFDPTHAFVASGAGNAAFNVTLTVTDAFGCSGIFSDSVHVRRTPNGQLIDPATDMRNCGGTDFDMTVFDVSNPPGSTNYSIDWGDGSTIYTNPTFPAGGVNHIYTTSEIFDLIYVVTGSNGCNDTTIYNIANITNPAIGAANPGGTTGCGPLNLCFPLNNFATNHPTTYYVVDYGDGSPTDTLPHPPPATVCHTYIETSCGEPGNQYVFGIRAINLCEESAATISPIRVFTGPETIIDTLPLFGCVNVPIAVENLTLPGFNSSCSNNTIYTWDFGNSTGVTTTNPGDQAPVYTSPGNYTVSLTAQNTCNTTTANAIICVEAAPIPNFAAAPDNGCAPFTTVFNDLSSLPNNCSGVTVWSVVFNGSNCLPSVGTFAFVNGTTENSPSPSIRFDSPGEYLVRQTITNSCGAFFFEDTITVQGPPSATINAIAAICAAQNATPTAVTTDCYAPITSYNWTFTNGTPASSVAPNPAPINYTTQGTFPIALTVTNACGNASDQINIVVNPVPPVLDPQVSSPICDGESADFSSTTVAGVTYQWTGPNGFTSNQQNFTINPITLAGTGKYYLTGTIGTCVGPTDSVSLTVIAPPVISVLPTNPSICTGDSVQLTASGGITYTWTPTTTITATTGSVVEVFPSVTTTYTVTGSNGTCDGTANVTINVLPLPTVNAGLDTILCVSPNPVQFSGTPAGGTWSGSGIAANGQFTPSTVGNFNVIYSFTDGNGCSDTSHRTLTVIAPTPANAGNDFSMCHLTPDSVLVGIPAGGTWSGAGMLPNGTFSPTTIGSNEVIYTFGAGLCATTDNAFITVVALPNVQAFSDTSVCANSPNITLSGTPLAGTWSGTGITNSNTGTYSPSTAGAGTHVVTYDYQDAVTTCSNSASVTIIVAALPTVLAGPDTTLCDQPIPVQLIGSPANGIWSGPNVSATGVFTPNGIGSSTVTYEFTSVDGCVVSDDRIIQVVGATPSDAGSDRTECLDGIAIQLTGLPAGGTWSGTDVSASGLFLASSSGTVTLTYSIGAGSCAATDEMDIIVFDLPVVTAGNDIATCASATAITLSGTPINGTWSGPGVAAGTSVFNPSSAGSGTHELIYSFTDGNGCINSDTLEANVSVAPTVSAGADTTICNQPFPVQLNGIPAGGTWSGTNVTAGGIFTPNATGQFTLAYSYGAGDGCTFTDDRVITVIAPVFADAGPAEETCFQDPNIQLSGTPATGTWSGSTIAPNGIYSPAVSGVFKVYYEIGAGNCYTIDSTTITVHSLPIVNAGANQAFCETAASTQFTGSPVGGAWSGQGITDAVLGTFNPSSCPVGTHDIVYTFTEQATGCTQRDTLVATINANPVVQFNIPAILCANAVLTPQNTTTGASLYNWRFGEGSTSTAYIPTFSYPNAGTYQIDLIATSGPGCMDSVSHSIEIYALPAINFSFTPDSSCSPVLVAFNNQSTGTNITTNWDFGNGQNSTNPNPPDILYLAGNAGDTNYVITLSISNLCNTLTRRDTITVLGLPVAILGTTINQGCSPVEVDIVNNSTGPPDFNNWDFGDGTTSNTNANILSHSYLIGDDDTTYVLQLIVSNTCGTDTATTNITLEPNTITAFFNTDKLSGCAPHTVQFTQFTTGSSQSSWTFGDGNISNDFSPGHTYLNAGTYNVLLTANNGCNQDTASVQITVFPSPIMDFTFAPDSACISEPFAFTNLSQNISSCNWDFGDGIGSTLLNPTHLYANTGSYSVVLTGTSQLNGCVASVTKTVTVSVNPTANFTGNPTFGCAPLTVNFNNLSNNATFNSWNFDDGDFSTQVNPTHIFINSGEYTVQLATENVQGCRDTMEVVITVYGLPTADFDVDVVNQCELPTTVTIQNKSAGAASYNWTFGDGGTSSATNPTYNYLLPGSYQLLLRATNTYGCTDTSAHTVVVYEGPEASGIIAQPTICSRYPVNFLSTSVRADSVLWIFSDGTATSGNVVQHLFTEGGSYHVTMVAFGPGGCVDSTLLATTITIHPTPLADFEAIDVTDPALSGSVFFSNLTTNADTYSWSFSTDETSSEESPTIRFPKPGEYAATLIASNEFGCSDTVSKELTVPFFFGLHIPNAMSPGHSNFKVANFVPIGIGLKSFELLIYDDWGNLIWQTTALDDEGRPTEYWDGTYKGAPVQQDSYVWKVTAVFLNDKIYEGKEYENGRLKRAGTVTILR